MLTTGGSEWKLPGILCTILAIILFLKYEIMSK